jgi:4'-phosphopantetheinyl transferase EntD
MKTPSPGARGSSNGARLRHDIGRRISAGFDWPWRRGCGPALNAAIAGRPAGDEGPDLAPLRAALAADGVLIGARRIRLGDEAALIEPRTAATPANLARRRASGAARMIARLLIGELGGDPAATLMPSVSGAPLWPDGFIGSLAHDDSFAVAVVARRASVAGLGVDVEPAEPLPADLTDLVLRDEEKRLTEGREVSRRLVFACKEAVYKAIHPLNGTKLEYADIEVRLDEGMASLMDGRRLRLAALAAERLIAVAIC